MIAEGHEEAVKELFNRYFNSLFHFGFSQIQDEQTVRDIIQNTFLKIWISRAEIDPNRSVKSYLFAITNNQLIDHFRKSNTHSLDFENFQDSISVPIHSSEQVPIDDLNNKIRDAMQQQPDNIKSVFFLCKQEGYKNIDIADILGVSVKTVEVRMTKLIKIIRENIT